MDSLPLIPAAPLGGSGTNGGTGRDGPGNPHYSTDGALRADVDLARRVLSDPRWPISESLRAKCIHWLEIVIELSDDDRARTNAIKSLIAADKLNLEQAKILLAAEKQSKPAELTVTHRGNVTLTGRLEALTDSFAGAADRAGESALPAHDPREPLDP